MAIKLIIAISVMCAVVACKPAASGGQVTNPLRTIFEGVLQDVANKLPEAAKPEAEQVVADAKAAFDECDKLLPLIGLSNACLSQQQSVALTKLKILRIKYGPLGPGGSNGGAENPNENPNENEDQSENQSENPNENQN